MIQILSVLGLLTLTALLVTNSNPQSVAMGIGLILLLGFTCYASRGLYWACLAKREHRLTLWAPR